MPHKGQHRENEENDEKHLRSFPGKSRHAAKAKEGSDQSDHEKHDSKSKHVKFPFKNVGSRGKVSAGPMIYYLKSTT